MGHFKLRRAVAVYVFVLTLVLPIHHPVRAGEFHGLQPLDVNHAPVITEGDELFATIPVNGFPDGFNLTLNATDPEEHTLTWSIPTQAENGTAAASGSGNSKVIDYTPNLNFAGTDGFVVRVTDEVGATDEIAITVMLTGGVEFPTFADVPLNGFGWSHIEAVYFAGITGGCTTSPLHYCPDNRVTRSQMAIFLLRGKHGSSFSPPVPDGGVFGDVPSQSFAAAWIEQLATEGITGGCGSGNYCPNNTVTRSQMAIFLLRAKHGNDYMPPPASGSVFGDVPLDGFAAAWIEQLVAEGITGGCGGGNYCPTNPVTRSQMAIFLQRTFDLLRP